MDPYTLTSLAVYFILMLAIGYYAYRKSTGNVSEYMLGGRKLHPAVGALSAGASDMSGWMLMGLPGAIYISGLSDAWIAVGLVIGAYLNYQYVAPRLRVYTHIADDAITIPDFFEKRFQSSAHTLRMFSALVIVIFFTLYTSSGMVAGGKLFEASFALPYELGIAVTAGVVVAYTLFGGFLAVSLTDFVQGLIMLMALVIVPVVALWAVGGLSPVVEITQGVNPNYLSMWPEGMTGLGLVSLLAWGLGYFGQPHIIVRFMAIRSLKDVHTARHIGMSWMLITVIGAVATGALGLAFVTKTGANMGDAETIFIYLSQTLFHPLIAGFLLAAILAAIMSTISSQLLVSSSSLTEDFYKHFVRRGAAQSELVLVGRLCVLVVSLVAALLALDKTSSILSLVSNAWAGFGAAFGPIILLSLYWKRLTYKGALAGMLTGAGVVLFWIYVPITIGGASLSATIYEIVPGFIANLLISIAVSLKTAQPGAEIIHTFDEMEGAMRQ